MRRVRYSRTAIVSFQNLLGQGAGRFGVDVAEEKRFAVELCISDYLSVNPHHGLRDEKRSMLHYHVRGTPFIVVYEYDDDELRVLFIVHKRSDRRRLDPGSVDWS